MMTQFLIYRVSMLFLLAFQLAALPLKYQKRYSVLTVSGCFFLTGILDYVDFFIWKGTNRVFLTVLEIIIVQATAYILCRYRDGRALFVGICSAAYVLVGNMAAFLFLLNSYSPIAAIAVQIVINTCFLALFVICCRRTHMSVIQYSNVGWWQLCFLPALLYVVVYALTIWPSDIYQTPENGLAVFLMQFLVGASYGLIIKLFYYRRKEAEQECGMQALNIQAESLKREMELLKEKNAQTAVWRHDMRHIFALINSYLAAGDTERIKELLKKESDYLDTLAVRRYCSNITINGVLTSCEAKAEEQGVSLDCMVCVPEQFEHINEFEFATILWNLLENAIHAASEADMSDGRWVKLSLRPVKGQLFLEIVNTCNGEMILSPDTGFPKSERGGSHGYGLRSVQAYAEKYQALFQYTLKGKQFHVVFLVRT